MHVAALATALGAASSCTPQENAALSWSFSFSNGATRQRTVRVEVSILRGSDCNGDEVVYSADVGRMGNVDAPPKLAPGAYALSGRAISEDCLAIASGCLPITLPASEATYEVVLEDTPETAVCTGSCASSCGGDGDGDGDGDSPGDGDGDGDGDGGLDAGDGDGDAGGDGDGDGDGDAGTDASVDPCPDGSQRPGGHCYRFVSDTIPWQDAEDNCVTWGGHLVSLNDADEEYWVYLEQLRLSFATQFWIGFTDQETETLWLWSDGSVEDPSVVTFDLADPGDVRFKVPFFVTYTHWGSNAPATGNSEPNNGNGSDPAAQNPGEDCGVSRGDRLGTPGGIPARPGWDDKNCLNNNAYVCER